MSSSSPITELEGLTKFKLDQEGKINQLFEDGNCFVDLVDVNSPRSWVKFRNSLWGNVRALEPLEGMDVEVKEGDKTTLAAQPVVEIPKTIPDTLGLDSSNILVRSEYAEAEQAALVANKKGFEAFLIGGQAGIGKSFFMIWLLMQRLALKLPTALQLREGHAILFHEGGTSSFLDPAEIDRYLGLSDDEPSGRIWALVDSSQVLSEPAPIFRVSKPFFVVEAASRQARFGWANKVHHRHFYMKTWAFPEVLQVRLFLGIGRDGPHQESQLRYLYDTYRAPIRALARCASEPRLYDNRIIQKVDEILPQVLRAALSSPDSDDSSHLIVRMEPDPDERDKYRNTIASRYILDLLWARHLKDSTDEMAHLYTALQGSAVTATAVGGIFELRIHQLFTSKEYSLRLFPLLQSKSKSTKFHLYADYSASYKEENLKLLKFTVSEVHPLDEGNIQLQIDHYYRPTANNYPSVDSLLLIRPTDGGKPILLMFQITRNKEDHDAKEVGLERVKELGFPPDTRMYYVVVTPLDRQPRIQIPKQYHGKMDVFYHPVNGDTLFSGTM